MGVLALVLSPVQVVLGIVEHFLFLLISLYDKYFYSPLQFTLSPIVAKVPREADLLGVKVTIFTANIVSWSRTILIIPVAWCLKYDYHVTAFLCIIQHDFLDHLDGIVAKVQKSVYGQVDDPLLGGFMDAFCDKIVNCVSLWTILVVTDFSNMTSFQIWLYVGACAIIIGYEFVLGVVRVQDYFLAYYARKYATESDKTPTNVAAVMEGKLKEKLESIGIACLCLAQGSKVPLQSISGAVGITCLLLSVRLAHASLEHKLKVRRSKEKDKQIGARQNNERKSVGIQVEEDASVDFERRISVFGDIGIDRDSDDLEEKSDISSEKDETDDVNTKETFIKSSVALETRSNASSDRLSMKRSRSVSSWQVQEKVDKVYTVGCFDLFHEGHRILMERLKQLGTQVIVGVHDSRSIFKLKKRVPIDGTSKRMANVKRYADVVFCIHGTDPTPYLKCIFDENEPVTSMYVRGDDMPNFPARSFIEEVMPVHFLPYTDYVSSTKIRKEVYNASMFGPHGNDDDHLMFY